MTTAASEGRPYRISFFFISTNYLIQSCVTLWYILILGVPLITLVLTVRVIVRQILTVNETVTTSVERPA